MAVSVSHFPFPAKSHPRVPISRVKFVVNATTNTAQIPNNAFHFTISNQSSLGRRPISPVTDDQILFRMDGEERASTRTDLEVGIVLRRLERLGERVREVELEKLKRGVRGEVSEEERELLEMMSREIVARFMEGPIKYLKSGDGRMEDKLKDMNFLVGILEEPYTSLKREREF